MEFRPEGPVSPTLMKLIKQKSGDQPAHEHPRSPTLLQQSVSESSKADRYSTSPRPWGSPQGRVPDQSPLGEGRDRDEIEPRSGSGLGYTVAHYGDEKPQTVSSRTFTGISQYFFP